MTTTPTTPADVLSQFTWHRQPAAEQLVRDHTLGLATHIEQHGNFLD